MTVMEMVIECDRTKKGNCTKNDTTYMSSCRVGKYCNIFQKKYGTTPDLFETDPRYKKEWLRQL